MVKGIIPKIALLLMAFDVFGAIHPSYCSVNGPIVEIISIETGKTTFNTWNSTSYYYRNEVMSVKAIVRNNDHTSRTAMIYVNAFDDLDVPFGIYVGSVTFSGNETKVIYCPIYVPKWAFSGSGRVTATAKTLPEGTYCPESTDAFYLLPGMASYLTVRPLTSGKEQLCGVDVWIDGDQGLAPATVQLAPDAHDVQIQDVFCEAGAGSRFGGMSYVYKFKCWEDGSTSVSRTIDMPISTNQTVTAYYVMQRSSSIPV